METLKEKAIERNRERINEEVKRDREKLWGLLVDASTLSHKIKRNTDKIRDNEIYGAISTIERIAEVNLKELNK